MSFNPDGYSASLSWVISLSLIVQYLLLFLSLFHFPLSAEQRYYCFNRSESLVSCRLSGSWYCVSAPCCLRLAEPMLMESRFFSQRASVDVFMGVIGLKLAHFLCPRSPAAWVGFTIKNKKLHSLIFRPEWQWTITNIIIISWRVIARHDEACGWWNKWSGQTFFLLLFCELKSSRHLFAPISDIYTFILLNSYCLANVI